MRFLLLIIASMQAGTDFDLLYGKFQAGYLKLRETSNSEQIGSILDALSFKII